MPPQSSPVGLATPFIRHFPSPSSVNSGSRPHIFPARLFGAQVDPPVMTESSSAPTVLPGFEPFGTTMSGVGFGIGMAAAQN
jgi:hypothetical protein